MAEGGTHLTMSQSLDSLGEYDADPESISQVRSKKTHIL